MIGSRPHKQIPGGLEGRGGLAPEERRLSGQLSARAVRKARISRSATASAPRASIPRRWLRSRRSRLRLPKLYRFELLNSL